MRIFEKIIIASVLIGGVSLYGDNANAQKRNKNRDVSPVILLETGPSDMAGYRKMVRVKYLSGNRVTAHYKAYNRREFINVKDRNSNAATQECARGKATSLKEIRAYEKSEAKRKRQGLAPEPRTFCIKNIPNWMEKNKDRYLNPIFASMPWVKNRQ